MNNILKFLPVIITIVFISFLGWKIKQNVPYGAPPVVDETIKPEQNSGRFGDLSKWVRPEGPLRIGLQAGHWKTDELPEELAKLKNNGGGTSRSGVAEWEVNLAIAQEAKKILEPQGFTVDIIPATVPPAYIADAFVAIHADGNANLRVGGFKVAAPGHGSASRNADVLAQVIESTYAQITGLGKDPNISWNMRGYYAFNWNRFEYTTHPMTPAVILETGFLTNPKEAEMLINNPQKPAEAIAKALIAFLKREVKT